MRDKFWIYKLGEESMFYYSIPQLSSTWSTDKRQSLMHYLAKTVKQRNPEYASFVTEMRHLQQASQVIMDNLDADIQVGMQNRIFDG